tara:strand:- start:26 stop:1174 length:1149 start_codon:yes stop_codon:yes gene_type:complete
MFLKDRSNISSERAYTDEGFLIVPARISRTGIQEYLAVEMGLTDRNPNDVIRVYRPPEEVFSKESLQSFSNKTVTNNHPPVLVDSTNHTQYSVGHSGPDVSVNGMFVETTLFVKDAETIKKIQEGKSEISNGYVSDIDYEEGLTPDGEIYDAVQRKIRGNHIAIVERGRAGSACKLADNLPNNGEKVTMAKITIDGVDYETSEQAAQAVTKLQSRLTDAEEKTLEKDKELEEKDEEMEEAKKEASKTEDSLKAKLDDAKSKVLTTDAIDKQVVARGKFVDQVLKIVPGIKWEGKDTLTLKREVVSTKRPNVQMDSQSDEYINVSFDMLVEAIENNSQQNLDNSIISIINDKNLEETRSAGQIARDKMIEDSRNAWKSKGDKS